jgi:hypothetical protein
VDQDLNLHNRLRDQQAHEEALRRFGGKMPIPSRPTNTETAKIWRAKNREKRKLQAKLWYEKKKKAKKTLNARSA